MSAAHNPKELRRAHRESVCYRCEVETVDGQSVLGLIVNISPYGCMIRTGRELGIGSPLNFALPITGRQTARVVWSMGGRTGLEFDRPIDLDPFLAMLADLTRPGDEMGIY
jgi:hypothetical protein